MGGNRNSGRKSDYSEVTARRICEDVAAGRTLADVCRDEWSPSRATVHRWFDQHPTFKTAVDEARIRGCFSIADEIISISDEAVPDSAQASRQRNRIEARRWVVSKLMPQVFGDRVSVDVTTRADPREAERRADERYLRLTGMPVESVGLVLEGAALRLPNGRELSTAIAPQMVEQDNA